MTPTRRKDTALAVVAFVIVALIALAVIITARHQPSLDVAVGL